MTFKVELIASDRGYEVGCPELPGCWTQGGTEEEAIANVRSAIAEHLAVAPADARPKKTVFLDIPDSPPAVGRDLTRSEAEHEPRVPVVGAERFKVIPWDMGLPAQWTSGKVSDLLDLLDGEDRRW